MNIKNLLIWLCLLTFSTVFAAPSEEETLCAPHEDIYFSCHEGRKIISVCASGNISPVNGYVQYRIGRPNAIEMEYPDMPNSPKEHFYLSNISGGNLNFTHLKFTSSKYNYVVFAGDVSGVYVKKDGKTLANLRCEAGDYRRFSPKMSRGIKTVDPEDGIDN